MKLNLYFFSKLKKSITIFLNLEKPILYYKAERAVIIEPGATQFT